MGYMANTLIVLVACLHALFLVLEMFFWDRPAGLKLFGHDRDFARASKVLAMNQGLYNGFLAAGLVWGLYLGEAGYVVKLFFLGCVVIAGVFGGLTASRSIFLVQALPAAIAGIALILSNG
jgi:putative membrane protein